MCKSIRDENNELLVNKKQAADTNQNSAQRILFLAPEWGHITKVGGLADVVTSLSQALIETGLDIRVVLLGYTHIQMKLHHRYFNPQLPFFLLEECSHPDYPKHIFYLVKHPLLDTIYEPYSPSYLEHNSALDILQALLLAIAPYAISENPNITWKPDVIHCHDWLCGLYSYFNKNIASLLPRERPYDYIPSLLTIHNAGYHGVINGINNENMSTYLQHWGVSIFQNFDVDSWKLDDQVNILATGLRYSERINTVSPTHALELLEQDNPISAILRERKEDFCGILNGVDHKQWDPKNDPVLKQQNYGVNKREVQKAKLYWKKYLEKQLQFSINTKIPLFISICRIVEQKGLELLFGLNHNPNPEKEHDEADKFGESDEIFCQTPFLKALTQNRGQLIILGEGESLLEQKFQMLSWKLPQNLIFLNYFHEDMAHILTAAADFFIMPSLYEPCGLNQIYALRYGTTPIVRKTGGLADTVQHKVNGLVFETYDDLSDVLEQAFHLWHSQPQKLWQMQQLGMEQDFSWAKNVHKYIREYNLCLEKSRARQT